MGLRYTPLLFSMTFCKNTLHKFTKKLWANVVNAIPKTPYDPHSPLLLFPCAFSNSPQLHSPTLFFQISAFNGKTFPRRINK
jgi:hypothetical protein